MGMVAAITPAVVVLIALVLVSQSWGVSTAALPVFTYLMPLLPLAVVLYWLVRRPAAVPAGLVFAAGLLVDVGTMSPLGFWALVYLLGAAVTRLSGSALRVSVYGRFVAFAGGFVLVGAVVWLLASVYALEQIEIEPLLQAIAGIIIGYPVLALLLWPLGNRRRRAPNLTLDRGR